MGIKWRTVWRWISHLSTVQWVLGIAVPASVVAAAVGTVIHFFSNEPLISTIPVAIGCGSLVALVAIGFAIWRNHQKALLLDGLADRLVQHPEYVAEMARQKAIIDAKQNAGHRVIMGELAARKNLAAIGSLPTAAPLITSAGDALKQRMIEGDKDKTIVFPYRKAVLQVKEVKCERMAGSGYTGITHVGCRIDLENHAGKSLKDCQVCLVSVNGVEPTEPKFLRIGKLRGDETETKFTVITGSVKRINFMKRDLTDVVSNPPMLLCLQDGDMPLSDGVENIIVLSLESEYEHPTFVKLRLMIPQRETAEISLISQSLDL